MDLVLIICLVVLLYIRTLNYYYLIDDSVKRDGYMYEVPLTGTPPKIFKERPSKLYRLFMIWMHCVNVSVIYLLWGWCPALLFAVHPMGVWGTAWVTGNYYATTAYFALISYFIIAHYPNLIGAMVAFPIFVASLNSTICSLSFPFIYLFIGQPWGLTLFIPLYGYLIGKRFRTGLKIRDSFNANKPLKTPFTYKRLFLMTKVVAEYIKECFYPNTLGMFGPFGCGIRDKQKVYDDFHSANKHFWKSLAICLAVFIPGLFISVTGTMIFFCVILLHSQWRLTGQFYAQRYLYLPLVGLCVVVGTALSPYPFVVTVVATFLVFRTHLFIPCFRNIEEFYLNDINCYPHYGQVYSNIAQIYLNSGDNLPMWKINEVTGWVMRAEEMEPDSWSAKMNVACLFFLLGKTEMALQKSKECLALLEPLGGLKDPVDRMKQQIIDLTAILEKERIQQQSGAIVSPAIQPDAEKVGTNGTRTEHTEEGIIEPIRTPELVG